MDGDERGYELGVSDSCAHGEVGGDFRCVTSSGLGGELVAD